MKNKLYIFGCSYSSCFEMAGINKEYHIYKNGWPKSWSEILSEKLNTTVVKKAKGGFGNDAIFDEFCIQSDKIKKNDIVIIGWSYLNRFRVPTFLNEVTDSSELSTIWDNISIHSTTPNFSKKTIEEISLSRNSILYEIEIHNRENLIREYSKSKGFKVYFWNASHPFENENGYLLQNIERKTPHDTFIQFVLRLGGSRIMEETNGMINDNHLGEMGHVIQANLFYNEIKLNL